MKNVKYTDNCLSIAFQKSLNQAGYPLFLKTSLGISNKKYLGSYQFREQAIVPQLSLFKRISKYFSLELFTNYPVPIHSNNSFVNNHYPQCGINVYFY